MDTYEEVNFKNFDNEIETIKMPLNTYNIINYLIDKYDIKDEDYYYFKLIIDDITNNCITNDNNNKQ